MDNTEYTAVQQRLRQLWRHLLDLPATQPLHGGSHFFELGGGSMLLLNLQVAIAREFTVEPAISELLACPTLGQMSALLLAAPAPGQVSAACVP